MLRALRAIHLDLNDRHPDRYPFAVNTTQISVQNVSVCNHLSKTWSAIIIRTKPYCDPTSRPRVLNTILPSKVLLLLLLRGDLVISLKGPR